MDSKPSVVFEMSSNPVFRIWHKQFKPIDNQSSWVEFSIHSSSSHKKLWMSGLNSAEPKVLRETEHPLTGKPVRIDVASIMENGSSSYKLISIMLDSLGIDRDDRFLVTGEIISTARKIIDDEWNGREQNLWFMAVEINITTVKLCEGQKTNKLISS